MNNAFMRSELLLSSDGMKKLANSTVAVFGVGGVGSYTIEGLARTGIGRIILIDYDIIDITNINRQIHATEKTIGMFKAEVMAGRIKEINSNLKVEVHLEKYNFETSERLLKDNYDYVVDAIDMISSKIDLITKCQTRNIRIISSMGAGNKLNPTMLKVDDIYNTKVCPLAKVMRRELRRRGVKKLKVVYSEEIPLIVNLESKDLRKAIPGSVGFVPSVAGLIIASEVVKDIVIGGWKWIK